MDDPEDLALAALRARLDRTIALVVCGMGLTGILTCVLTYLALAALQRSLLLSLVGAAAAGMLVIWQGTSRVLTRALSMFAWKWSEALAAQYRVGRGRLDELIELRNIKR